MDRHGSLRPLRHLDLHRRTGARADCHHGERAFGDGVRGHADPPALPCHPWHRRRAGRDHRRHRHRLARHLALPGAVRQPRPAGGGVAGRRHADPDVHGHRSFAGRLSRGEPALRPAARGRARVSLQCAGTRRRLRLGVERPVAEGNGPDRAAQPRPVQGDQRPRGRRLVADRRPWCRLVDARHDRHRKPAFSRCRPAGRRQESQPARADRCAGGPRSVREGRFLDHPGVDARPARRVVGAGFDDARGGGLGAVDRIPAGPRDDRQGVEGRALRGDRHCHGRRRCGARTRRGLFAATVDVGPGVAAEHRACGHRRQGGAGRTQPVRRPRRRLRLPRTGAVGRRPGHRPGRAHRVVARRSGGHACEAADRQPRRRLRGLVQPGAGYGVQRRRPAARRVLESARGGTVQQRRLRHCGQRLHAGRGRPCRPALRHGRRRRGHRPRWRRPHRRRQRQRPARRRRRRRHALGRQRCRHTRRRRRWRPAPRRGRRRHAARRRRRRLARRRPGPRPAGRRERLRPLHGAQRWPARRGRRLRRPRRAGLRRRRRQVGVVARPGDRRSRRRQYLAPRRRRGLGVRDDAQFAADDHGAGWRAGGAAGFRQRRPRRHAAERRRRRGDDQHHRW